MKKMLKGLATLSILLLITGCSEEKEEEIKEVLKVTGTGDSIVYKYYNVNENTNIYTSYDSIEYEDKEISDLLLNNEIDIYDLISKTEYIDSMNDGGSKLYKDNNVYISICDSLEENGNNHNIYIMNNQEYAASMCSFNIIKLEDCLSSSINKNISSKKVSTKNGKLKDITSNKNYEKLVYKKSSIGEFIIIKTNDEDLINDITKYFKKKNKNYYTTNFSIYLNEVYHIFFYNKKNSSIEEKINTCLNDAWNTASE